MKIRTKFFWLLVGIVLIAGNFLVFFVFLDRSQLDDDPTTKGQIFYTDLVVARVNQERSREGLPELLVNNNLEKAAIQKAEDMATNGYFSHFSQESGKKWSDFIEENGYIYLEAGENLAKGYDDLELLVAAWMSSPTHRENIVSNKYLDTGVGYAVGEFNGKETVFVVQFFGSN